MPDLVHPRFAPGVFISAEHKQMYAFGGQHDSIERLTIGSKTSVWQIVDVEIPMDLGLGLQLFPMS